MLIFLAIWSRHFLEKIYIGVIIIIHLIACLWYSSQESTFENEFDNYLYALNWTIAAIKSTSI